MRKSTEQYWTGIFGIGVFALGMIEIPLYFIYSGPPPLWNILTRTLVDLLLCIGFIGFIIGFKNIISKSNSDYEWLSTFIFSIGLTYTILTFVADSIQVGSVWVSNSPIDPTVVGAGGEGALLIYGPIDHLLIAVLLIASGYAIIKTTITPVWIGWLAFIISVFHLSLIPTIFNLTEPPDFYSANGWNIPVAAGQFLIWILIVSIFLIRGRQIKNQ